MEIKRYGIREIKTGYGDSYDSPDAPGVWFNDDEGEYEVIEFTISF